MARFRGCQAFRALHGEIKSLQRGEGTGCAGLLHSPGACHGRPWIGRPPGCRGHRLHRYLAAQVRGLPCGNQTSRWFIDPDGPLRGLTGGPGQPAYHCRTAVQGDPTDGSIVEGFFGGRSVYCSYPNVRYDTSPWICRVGHCHSPVWRGRPKHPTSDGRRRMPCRKRKARR